MPPCLWKMKKLDLLEATLERFSLIFLKARGGGACPLTASRPMSALVG